MQKLANVLNVFLTILWMLLIKSAALILSSTMTLFQKLAKPSLTGAKLMTLQTANALSVRVNMTLMKKIMQMLPKKSVVTPRSVLQSGTVSTPHSKTVQSREEHQQIA